jgi:hypothetical protein
MTDASYLKSTDRQHVFVLTFRMTLSFVTRASGSLEGTYPIYILESKDGSYYKKLSVGSDLVSVGAYMQLKFEKLLRNRNYKLTRLVEEDLSEVVFDDVPFSNIVDQNRQAHQEIEKHAYCNAVSQHVAGMEAVSWNSDEGGEGDNDGSSGQAALS